MKKSIVILTIDHIDAWTADALAQRAASTVQVVLAGIGEVTYQGMPGDGVGDEGVEMCAHCEQMILPDDAFLCDTCGGTVHADCYDNDACLARQAAAEV